MIRIQVHIVEACTAHQNQFYPLLVKDIYSPGADIGAHKGAHGVKPLGQGCRPGIQVGFCVLLVTRGIMEQECSTLLKTFFADLRERNKMEKEKRSV